MVVYGDILVLVNMYIDFFLLLLTKRLLHLEPHPLRLFLGSLVGGLTGLLALLPVGKALEWYLLLASALLICFVSFFDRRWPLLIKAFLCFAGGGLIFSGGVLIAVELLSLPAAVIAGRVYFQISPLMLLVATVIFYLVSSISSALRGPADREALINRVTLETHLGKAEFLMKTDTGCSLTEPFSGLPAAVVELDAISSIAPKPVLDYLRGEPPKCGIRLIPCATLNGESILPAFKPDKFYLSNDGRSLNCYVAVTKNRLSASSWRGLLNPEILR